MRPFVMNHDFHTKRESGKKMHFFLKLNHLSYLDQAQIIIIEKMSKCQASNNIINYLNPF